MSTNTKVKNLKMVDIEDIQKAKSTGHFTVIVNNWWVVTPDNEVMLYNGRAPQCNLNKAIAEKVRDSLYPDCKIVQIETAFVPLDMSDF